KKFNKPVQVRYFERSTPNALWQMDIMTFMLKGQYRIYLIGIIDDNSRYIVNHGLFRRQTEDNVLDVLRGAIEKNGTPSEVLTDNGRQFYSWRGRSRFTKFCIKVGIQHIRSRPYHPQTLGKIESF
ncbi:MAG: DDE-type integrase/transposase/recombinase, partial [Elusimicrobiota bacterium]